MWAKLIAWLTGGGLKAIAGELGDAYEARLRAETDAERPSSEPAEPVSAPAFFGVLGIVALIIVAAVFYFTQGAPQ